MLLPSQRSPSPFSWCHTVCRSDPQEGSSQPGFSSHHPFHHCMKKKWGWHTLPDTNRDKHSKPHPPSYKQSSWLKVADGHLSSAQLEPSEFLVGIMLIHCSPGSGLLQDLSQQQAGTYSTSTAILRSEVSFHLRVDSYTPYKSSKRQQKYWDTANSDTLLLALLSEDENWRTHKASEEAQDCICLHWDTIQEQEVQMAAVS